MALNPSNSSNLEQLVLKGLNAERMSFIYSTLFVNNNSRTIIKRKNKNNINQSKHISMNTFGRVFFT